MVRTRRVQVLNEPTFKIAIAPEISNPLDAKSIDPCGSSISVPFVYAFSSSSIVP